jgi:hypothetical protein
MVSYFMLGILKLLDKDPALPVVPFAVFVSNANSELYGSRIP